MIHEQVLSKARPMDLAFVQNKFYFESWSHKAKEFRLYP